MKTEEMKSLLQSAKILQTIDNDISMCSSWASYHIAMAVTGATKKRKICHGTQGPELTDDEKVEDSMETARQHLHNMGELIDKKKEILNNIPQNPHDFFK